MLQSEQQKRELTRQFKPNSLILPEKFFKKNTGSASKYKLAKKKYNQHIPIINRTSTYHSLALKKQQDTTIRENSSGFLQKIKHTNKTQTTEYPRFRNHNLMKRKKLRYQSNFDPLTTYLQPKKYKQIMREHSQQSSERKRIHQSYKIKKPKKEQLFYQENQHFSRYTYQELKSLFTAMITQAKGEYSRFKKCLLVVLNLAGLIIEQTEFDKILKKYPIVTDFETFSQVYKQFEKHHFRQSIYDSLNILFHNYLHSDIHIADIKSIFNERLNEKQSQILNDCFVEKIEDYYGIHRAHVTLREIYQLCYHQVTLCQKIYEYYIDGLKENTNKHSKISNHHYYL